MITKLLTTLSILSLLIGCGNSKEVSPTPSSTTIVKDQASMVQTEERPGTILYVNSYKAQKLGNTKGEFVFLTQEGENRNGEWEYNVTEISGFEYEPGYFYKIKVAAVVKEGKPQLELIQQYTKERDASYFKLHNIWTLTHLNEKAIEVTDKRPVLEIFLNNMKIGGRVCNEVFGKITSYSENQITFGQIGRTKMMCDELALEDDYISGLDATRTFKVHEGVLILFDENSKEVLRLKRVD